MLISELEEILYNRVDTGRILTLEKMETSECLRILNLTDSKGESPFKCHRLIKAELPYIKESLWNGYYDPSDIDNDTILLESIQSIRTVKDLKTWLRNHKTDWYEIYLDKYYVEWL